MADKTGISWTDATWSPVVGCSRVSEGCRNCYSERLVATRLRHTEKYSGLAQMTQAGPRWTNVVRCVEDALLQPLRWSKPRRIFVNSMSDTFHKDVPDEFLDRMFAVMALCPQHTFQVLTKRPERAAEYLSRPVSVRTGPIGDGSTIMTRGEWIGMFLRGAGSSAFWNTKVEHDRQVRIGCDMQFLQKNWPLPNVWIGTSVENQAAADERIPHLLKVPAAVRFLSCEPLLGPVDLTRIGAKRSLGWRVVNALTGSWWNHDMDCEEHGSKVHWCIAGGESGPNARPMHPDWARSLRDQCAAAGVPFHHKQNGEWATAANQAFGRFPGRVGALAPDGTFVDRLPEDEDADLVTVKRVGVKNAGRDLYGEIHDAFPEVAGAR